MQVGTKDGIKDGIKELTERQLFIVDCLRNDGTINITDLAYKMKLSVRTLMREFAQLQQYGVIQRIGTRKDGYWQVIR